MARFARRCTAVAGSSGALVLAALVLAPAASAAPTEDSSRTAGVVAATNAERGAAGCPPLVVESQLATAAQRHADDMADEGYFSHTSQDGRDFTSRAAEAGYEAAAAENIAYGQPDAASVVAEWMDSPGHRRIILDCSLTTIGVGVAGAEPYWVQDFGR
jgi:uncharacterized protein YkwD